MFTNIKRPISFLLPCLTLAVLLAGALPAGAASTTVSAVAPTVDGEDIAQLTGSTDQGGDQGHFWSNRPWHGQSFTTGSSTAGYHLSAVTLKNLNSNNGGSTLWNVRVGTINGSNVFTPIVDVDISGAGVSMVGNTYVTWTFDTPVKLDPNTLYGFDVHPNGSGFVSANSADGGPYAGGQGYSHGDNLAFSPPGAVTMWSPEFDRVFHVDMESAGVLWTSPGSSNALPTTVDAYVTLKNTNATSWLYWDTTDKGTDFTWSYTNSLGNLSTGLVESTISNLSHGTIYYARFYGTNSSITNFSWSEAFSFTSQLVIANSPVTGIDTNSAIFHSTLYSLGTNYDVYVYWGTNNGGAAGGSWGHTNSIGSWTNTASTNLNFTTNILTSDTDYYYTFLAINANDGFWATPSIAFRTVGMPKVNNGSGATPGPNYATLNGNLVSGTTADVTVYWGTKDGGNTNSAWAHTNSLGTLSVGAFSTNTSMDLTYGVTYYYRCYATNTVGDDWADSTETFTSQAPPRHTYPTNGLMGMWTFDDDTADDSSGNGYDGVATLPTQYSTDTPGGLGKSVDLNGNQYIIVDDGTANQSVFDLDVLTIAFWAKEWPTENWGAYVTKRGEGGRGYQIRRDNNTANMAWTLRGTPGDDDWDVSANASGEFNNWVHVICTYGDGYRRIYHDNVLKGELSETGAITDAPNDYLAFGCRDNTQEATFIPAGYASALQDDIYIYNRVITASERAMLYGSPGRAGLGLGIENTAATGLTTNSVTMNSTLYATQAMFNVYVYWGTNDGGTVEGAWSYTNLVGSYTNIGSTNLSFSTNNLVQGEDYYYRFMGKNLFTNEWGTPTISFTTINPPTVINGAGATPAVSYATLNGELTGGGLADIFVYWGPTDEGMTAANWANTNSLGELGEVAFSTDTSLGLIYGETYYYRCFATNTAGGDWADSTASFTTEAPFLAPIGNTNVLWDFWTTQGEWNGWTLINGDEYFTSGNGGGITPGDGAGGYGYDSGQVTNFVIESPIISFNQGASGSALSWEGAGGASTEGLFANASEVIAYNGGVPQDGGEKCLAFLNLTTGQYDAILPKAANGTAIQDYTLEQLAFEGIDTTQKYSLHYYENDAGGWGWGQLNYIDFKGDVHVPGLSITNTVVSDITTTSATFNATFNPTQSVFDVSVYWGTNDGGTVESAWGHTNYVGSYTNIGSTNLTFTTNGLTQGQQYHYRFRAENILTNLWGAPTITFTTLNPPTVNNGTGGTPGVRYATLSGELTSGSMADIHVYWGPTDEGTTATNWANTNIMGSVFEGTFSTNTSVDLTYGVTYYYRCYSTNAAGEDWANSTTNFTILTPTKPVYAAGLLSGTLSGNMSFVDNPANGDGYNVVNMGPERAKYNSGWGGTTTYAYTGEMYFNGTDYFFIESIDDKTWLEIDGSVYINDDVWNVIATSGLISKPAGWYDFELRMSNGGGGAGYVSRNPGFQYHDGGGTSDAEIDNDYPEDPGDASLFRYDTGAIAPAVSLTNTAVSSIGTTSATFNATLEATDAAFDVYVYWGTSDGGAAEGSWDYTNSVGSYTNVDLINLSFDADSMTPGQQYNYRFMAQNVSTNMWGAPTITFLMYEQPVVNNGTGPAVALGSATLNGELTAGSQADVYLYWGTSDGGTVASNWENTNSMGVLGEVTFSTNETDLLYGVTYHYRCYATNYAGEDWADSTETFTTLPPQPVTHGDGIEETIWDGVPAGTDPADNIGVFITAAESLGASDAQGILTNHLHYQDDASVSTRAAALGAVGFDNGNFAMLWVCDFTPDEDGAWGFRNNNCDDEYSFWIDDDQNDTFDQADDRFFVKYGCCAGSGDQYTPVLTSGQTYKLGFCMNDTGGGGYFRDLEFWSPSRGWIDLNPGDAGQSGLWQYPLAYVVPTIGITNTAVTDVTSTSATFNATLHCTQSVFEVYAYWGTTDGGAAKGSWGNTNLVGSYTNVLSNSVSFAINGLIPGTEYNYRFLAENGATNIWGAPTITFSTYEPPVVDNGTGADVAVAAATLNGNLTAGSQADIFVYWGTSDGGTDASAWANTNVVGEIAEGAFSTTASDLLYGVTYHYRCFATNLAGGDWADSTESFTTFVPPTAIYDNGLYMYGYHTGPNGVMDLDANNAGGMMGGGDPTQGPTFHGQALFTTGPNGRGLDFDNDADFTATGAVGQNDQYSTMFLGYFAPAETGTFGFRNAGDDDRAGIWFDLDQDGIFESSTPGLGSNRGEQLSWEDGGNKQVALNAGLLYLVAFTHSEGTGGSRCDFRFTTPSLTERIIKPADPAQDGMWLYISGTNYPSITNTAVSSLTSTSATFNATLDATQSVFGVTVYWGTNDGGAAEGSWGNTNFVGSYTNVTSFNVPFSTNGLTPGQQYYYRFYAENDVTNMWGAPSVTFSTYEPPIVTHGAGVSPQKGYAILKGNLTQGSQADVYVYWGTSDGGTDPSAWANTNMMGEIAEGAFSTNTSQILYGLTYYYRCFATNLVGSDWADATDSFVTPFPGQLYENNALRGYGYHYRNNGVAMDLDGNGGMMGGGDPTTFNNYYGTGLLTNGPGNRGLDFDTDQDFKDLGLIADTQNDNYSTLFFGHLYATVSGDYEFQREVDDDQMGIWLDLNQDGVFESSTAGLGSDRGEQLQYDNDGGIKTVTLEAGEFYMFAVTHSEGTGGSQVDVNFKAPTMPGFGTIQPATDPNQDGMWRVYTDTSFAYIENTAPSDITTTSATFNAGMDGQLASFDVYVYWGTSDGGTTPGAWAHTNLVGSYSNDTVATPSFSTNGLTVGQEYYYTFAAQNPLTNMWATPSTNFTTAHQPVINNGSGGSPREGYASLTGNLTDGSMADVTIYWGTADGGTDTTTWEGTSVVGRVPEGAFSANTDGGLIYGVQYYYRCYATNAAGDAWAEVTNFVTALPTVYSTSNALNAYGYHINNDALAMNLHTNGGMMGGGDPTTFSNFYAHALLTNGPGDRGLNFDNDGDFQNLGIVNQADNYSTMFEGYLHAFTAGDYELRSEQDDDAMGIWLDLDQDGVFESSQAGLGSNRKEQLQWDGDRGIKTLTLAAGYYRFAVTHREGGGGSGVDVNFKAPWMSAEQTVQPTTDGDQLGTWVIIYDIDEVTISNAPVASVTRTSAVFNATLYATQSVFDVYAYWGDNDGGTTAGSWDTNKYVGSYTNIGSTNLSFTTYELAQGTEYYYTFLASNAATNMWATPSVTFTTDTVIVNGPATGLSATSAVVNATLYAPGAGNAYDVRVFWGTNDEGTVAGSWDTNAYVGSYTNEVFTNLSFAVSNLNPGTPYYYAYRATQGGYDAWAQPSERFDTFGVPRVRNLAPDTYVGYATMNGELISTGGAPTTVTLYWGTTDAGTASNSWANTNIIGGSEVPFVPFSTNTPSGLYYGQTYYYRCYAVNSNGGTWAESTTSFVTVPVTEPTVPSGPMGYWSFDDPADVGNDDSGNGNDGSQIGDAQYYGGGIQNGALTVDGLGDYLNCGSDIALAGQNFSVSFWSKRDGTGEDYVLGHSAPAVNNNTLHVGFRDADTFTFAFWSNDLNYDNAALNDTVNYHHFVCTFDSTTGAQVVYMDGNTTPVATRTSGSTLNGLGDFYIGTRTDDPGTACFDGLIDEVYVYQRVLGTGDVSQLYLAPVNEAELIGIENAAPAENYPNYEMNAVLNATGSVFDVYVYWGTNDGGASPGGWDYTNQVASYTNQNSISVNFASNGLDEGVVYYYTFMAQNAGTNIWASPSTNFLTLSTPAVNNGAGATAHRGYSTLTGELTSGNQADIYVFWGPSDGGMNKSAWANTNVLGSLGEAPFSTDTTRDLIYGVTYHYRCYASNDVTDAWAATTTNFQAAPLAIETVPVTSDLLFALDAQDVDGDGDTSDNPAAGALATWNDTTANNVDFVQIGASPTYTVGTGPNNKNYVAFLDAGGNTDRMYMQYPLSGETMAGPTRNTVSTFAVMYYHSGVVYFQYDNGARHSGEGAERWDFGGLNNTLINWSGANTLATGWHILELRYDGSDFDIYVDGSNELTLNDATRALGTGTSRMALGGQNDGNTGNQSIVDYAEFIHYNAALSAEDRDDVGGYLAWKYGMGSAYGTYGNIGIQNESPAESNLNYTMNGVLDATQALFNVNLYWGTNNGGASPGGWEYTNSIGTFTNENDVSLSFTTNGLPQDTTYYYTFMAYNGLTNMWATPITNFTTLVAPAVTNTGATQGPGSATLGGDLTDGTLADVTVYWGATDGGTTKSAWAHTNEMGSLPEGAFSTNTTSDLIYGVTYYYRCYATNSVSGAWAASSTPFTPGMPLTSPYVAGLLGGHESGNPSPGPNSGNLGVVLGPYGGRSSAEHWNDVIGNGDSTLFYNGEIYMDGGAYTFVESLDDGTRLIIDGTTVVDHNTWNITTHGTVTKPKGWHGVEIRFNNGGGGYGPVQQDGWTASFGFGMDADGNDNQEEANFVFPEDPGDKSLFRYDTGATPVALANVANDAPVVNHPNYEMHGTLNATQSQFSVSVYWGTNNAGASLGGWQYTNHVGSYTNQNAISLAFTTNGLDPDTTYYYAFMAQNQSTNMWATPVTNFTTLVAPTVINESAITVAGAATMRGNLSNGNLADVTVYWGTSDGGTTPGNWANTNTLGSLFEGEFSTDTPPDLVYGVTYYYRCYATNAVGADWADSTTNFVTTTGIGLPGAGSLNFAFYDNAALSNLAGIDDGVANGENGGLFDLPPTSEGSLPAYFQGKSIWTGPVEIAGNPSETYCAMWWGYFRPPLTGTYTFYQHGDDYEILWIDTDLNGEFEVSAGDQVSSSVSGSWNQPQTKTVDLTAGEYYPIAIAFNEGTGGDFMDLTITKPGGTAEDVNPGASSQAGWWHREIAVVDPGIANVAPVENHPDYTMNATLDALNSFFDVYVYWGTNNGGASPGGWDYNNYIGSYTNQDSISLIFTTNDLPIDTTYYYTFVAQNGATNMWATPSLSFKTLGYEYTLPFVEPFDARIPGVLDGQYGWETVDTDVQSGTTHMGARAACLTSATGDMVHRFIDGQTDVWTDFYAQPSFGDIVLPPDDSTYAFLVDRDGYVVAYDGQTYVQLSNDVLTEGEWVRFTVHSDYATETWDLYVDEIHVVDGFDFYTNTVSTYTQFGVGNVGAANDSYVDTINIETTMPKISPPGVIFMLR